VRGKDLSTHGDKNDTLAELGVIGVMDDCFGANCMLSLWSRLISGSGLKMLL